MDAPDIIVTVKGNRSTIVSTPSGSSTRLVELSDVTPIPRNNGDVLTYVAANSKFEFRAQLALSNTTNLIVAQISSNVSQLPANTDPQAITYDTNTLLVGVTHTLGDSRVYANTSGTYLISAVLQLGRTGSGGGTTQYVDCWLRKNGANVANSALRAVLEDNDAYTTITETFILELAANDYIEVVQAVSSSALGMGVTRTNTLGGGPAGPSILFSMVKLAGTGAPFSNIAVAGQNTISSSQGSTLTLVAGSNMTLTTDNVFNTITFASAPDVVTSVAGKVGAVALNTNDIAENLSSNLWFTAARVRANISNTAPINYDPSTGIISHALSGITPAGYGDAATVPKVIVDNKGHVTGVTNTAIAISANAITSGTLVVARGGTGQTAITVNGSLLIGNTVSGGFDVNPITQGSGILVTNDKGSITIAATGAGAIDQYARDKANGAFDNSNGAFTEANTANVTAHAAFNKANGAAQNAFTTVNVATQFDVVADSNTDTLTLVAGAGMTILTSPGTITFAAIAAATNSFSTINVAGQANVVADSSSDTLTLVAGLGISITTDGPNDTITIINSMPDTTIDQFARDRANGAFGQANIATTNADAAFARANGAYGQANIATTNADAAFARANASFANANTAIYTAAQIRANISNTAPINYDSTTGIISHALSGVAPTTYGNTTFVPQVTVDNKGHITSASNVAIVFPPDQYARDQANGAFDKANTANVTGQAAFDKANSGFTLATTANTVAASAYAQANIATTNADAAFAKANSGFTLATTGNTVAASAYAQANIATTNADAAFARANAAYANANTAIYTAAQIRANISNTTPINYDSTTGIISHALSGAVATTYGNTTFVPQVTVDDKGHVTSASNVAIVFPPDQYARDKANGAAQNSFVTVNVAGQNNVVADSNTDTLTLISGTGISITTDAPNDTITIAATGGSSIDQFARDHANGAFDHSNGAFDKANTANVTAQAAFDKANGSAQLSFVTINVAGQNNVIADSNSDTLILIAGSGVTITTDAPNDAITIIANVASVAGRTGDIVLNTNDVTENAAGPYYFTAAKVRANISNTAPINYDSVTGIISHALSGVGATGYGTANVIPVLVVNDTGHLTLVTNTAIAITAAQITSGTLAVVRGGTGQTAITVNGSLLIGNTVSGGYDVNPITPGSGITVTNDKGSITISAAGGGTVSGKSVEIDFGSTPVSEASFVIVDGGVAATSNIVGSVAYTAPTGKDLDELDMDQLDLKFSAEAGTFTLYATGLSGSVAGAFKINYHVG